MFNNICKAPDCKKTRKKESSFCSVHLYRHKRYNSFEVPEKQKLPSGITMICKHHGLLTVHESIIVNPRISPYTGKVYKPQISCGHCSSERLKLYKKNNPELFKVRALQAKLKRNFNITLDDFYKLKSNQNNFCAICKLPESIIDKKTNMPIELSVDHCHITGRVRGLLCKKCNLGLGYFNDSFQLLERAIMYIIL